jgi:predicted peroxiredoxin
MSAPPALGTLAIVVTRGTSNNLFQVATLVRAATALEATVRVFFEGDAARKLARDRVEVDEWSPSYAPVLAQLHGRLRAADFQDLTTFLRDAKEHGDDVQFWVSAQTLEAHGLDLDALVPSVDGVLTHAAFDDLTRTADHRLTF